VWRRRASSRRALGVRVEPHARASAIAAEIAENSRLIDLAIS